MTQAQPGKVYLVGAGPGDPELLTLKAAGLLKSADIIYHDDLVSPAVVGLASAAALVISVGKRCGAKRITQTEINGRLIESARQCMRVVRLKSGDPLIFGRAGEEIGALRAAQVPFEIVPGITTAFAAAAAVNCSLTDRGAASSILFLSGHHAKEKNSDLPPTRVVYMPGSEFARLASEWLEGGESPELPCVLVSNVSRPDQAILQTTLQDLARVVESASPAVLLAGWAFASASRRELAAAVLASAHQAIEKRSLNFQ